MTAGSKEDPPSRTVAAAVNEIEGFLLLHAEREAAHREAREFTDRMPWLSTAEREEISRHYVEQRGQLTELMLRTVVNRAHSLRHEYESRYRLLRARLLKTGVVVVCAALLWTAGLTTWFAWPIGD
ncbi:hypothetical protein [Streptomyces cavernae]|uniref:hypothetical protein n=1 Tax=Streptomyces cavernae TaxID=2259034 RepID=UPI000FEB789B|nr:hypothetical protein [Streptomyces cavernae]